MTSSHTLVTKSQVAQTLNVQPYIIDLWSAQFSIKTVIIDEVPHYAQEDVSKLNKIKTLIYEKGLHLERAKKIINGTLQCEEQEVTTFIPAARAQEPCAHTALITKINHIKKQLLALRNHL